MGLRISTPEARLREGSKHIGTLLAENCLAGSLHKIAAHFFLGHAMEFFQPPT